MKKYLVITFFLFFNCGGTQDSTNQVVEKTDTTDTTTSTLADTTTSTLADTTTSTLADTTTSTTIVSNYCGDCDYLDIKEIGSNIGQVPKLAWSDYQRIMSENSAQDDIENFEIIINVGPTTELYFLENESYIQKGINFWKNFILPEKYYAFFYSYNDLNWASNELTSAGFEGDMARAPCRDGVCSGANSGIYQRSPHFGIGTYGINSKDSIDPYRYGPLHIHEITHSVVAAQWIGNARNPQQAANDSTPCWLNEGIAHAAGISLGVDTYEEYLEIRSSQVTGRHIQPPFNDYSASTILNYYNESLPGICTKNPDYVLGYSIGYLTVEALNAMNGSDSAMHMFSNMASGKNFEEAFEITYKLTWSDAKPIFAEYVSSVISDLFNS